MTGRGVQVGSDTWALVPARSGSKSISDKNLSILQGHSLLAWAVVAGVATPEISRTFVSTDSEKYAGIARLYGADVPFLRPGELSGDETTDAEVFAHFLRWAQTRNLVLPRYILHLRPTTPVRTVDVIQGAIALAHGNEAATALRSVHEAPESPYKWFLIDESGLLTTLGGDRRLDQANAARQAFPRVFVPNGYVDVINTKSFLMTGQLHGAIVLPILTDEALEVDTGHSLEVLRAMAPLSSDLVDLANSCGPIPE